MDTLLGLPKINLDITELKKLRFLNCGHFKETIKNHFEKVEWAKKSNPYLPTSENGVKWENTRNEILLYEEIKDLKKIAYITMCKTEFVLYNFQVPEIDYDGYNFINDMYFLKADYTGGIFCEMRNVFRLFQYEIVEKLFDEHTSDQYSVFRERDMELFWENYQKDITYIDSLEDLIKSKESGVYLNGSLKVNGTHYSTEEVKRFKDLKKQYDNCEFALYDSTDRLVMRDWIGKDYIALFTENKIVKS